MEKLPGKFHTTLGDASVKHQIIEAFQGKYPVKELCSFLRISRSGYYKYLQRQQQPNQDEKLQRKIRKIYEHRKGAYGYRRIQAE
ncbi:IS3 family transposase [Aneurinibacillus aneurinilyticus]|uniref:IS3 family transposase n=1 Tax=Aneurinibacillus aneurinilyticus TaxID=1391 RepID=A0A848CXP2_ANEAE|nr:IS3 family transposase [Aneurinibacillus aneurinilyticus]